MENTEENCEMIWKLWTKDKSNTEKIWGIQKKWKLISEMVWNIQKKLEKNQVKYRRNIS